MAPWSPDPRWPSVTCLAIGESMPYHYGHHILVIDVVLLLYRRQIISGSFQVDPPFFTFPGGLKHRSHRGVPHFRHYYFSSSSLD